MIRKHSIAAVPGANPKWFNAKPRGCDIRTIRVIMKDGKIFKNNGSLRKVVSQQSISILVDAGNIDLVMKDGVVYKDAL